MSADVLLSRLDRVRQTGPGRAGALDRALSRGHCGRRSAANRDGTMARLKFPPFGASLWRQRSAGNHSEIIHLLLGNRVRPDLDCGWNCIDHPHIWMLPDEWQRDRFDWRAVTGAQVALFDFAGWADEENPKLFEIVSEVAWFSADVEILPAGHTLDGKPLRISCAILAHAKRYPSWWTLELEKRNSPRRVSWIKRFLDDGRKRLARTI